MKRTVCLLIVSLLLLAAEPAAYAQTADDSQNAAPIMLLSEEYNPFYSVALPDDYTLERATIELADHLEYTMLVRSSDTMDNVITFAAGLLYDSTNVDKMTHAMSLMTAGSTEINGEADGISIRVRINDTLYGGGAESDARFALEITASLEADVKYETLFTANMQHPAFDAIAQYLQLFPLTQASLTVYAQQNRAELFSQYQPENAQQLKDALLQAYPDEYSESSGWLTWRDGDIQISVILDDAAGGSLYLLVNIPDSATSLADYSPPVTLASLGFDDYRQASAKCTNQNNDAGVWLSISKDEWGENSNESERNALTFMAQEHEAFVLVFYYPQTQLYKVTVEINGEQAKYDYLASEDRYTDEFGGSDLTEATQIASSAFLGPDEECGDVLGLAIGLLKSFVQDTLQTTVDELYSLDYE